MYRIIVTCLISIEDQLKIITKTMLNLKDHRTILTILLKFMELNWGNLKLPKQVIKMLLEYNLEIIV